MNTQLSSAQMSLRDAYRRYALDKIEPLASALESHTASSAALIKSMGSEGFLGLTVSKTWGGQGEPLLHLALFIEAISQYEPGLALTLANQVAVMELIERYGTDKQKARYLPILSCGDKLASLAIGEKTTGWNPHSIETTTERKDDDRLIITGRKRWAVNAEIAQLMVVLAKVDGQPRFLILDSLDNKSVHISANLKRLGLCSAPVNDVEFRGLCIPATSTLASPDDCPQAIDWAMSVINVLLAAAAVGLTQALLTIASDHVKRLDKGEDAISRSQSVQWKLADLSCALEGARLLTYRAAWDKDRHAARFTGTAAMCRWFADQQARLHSGEALAILGEGGLIAESPLSRLYRDAKSLELIMGTADYQKSTLVKALGI